MTYSIVFPILVMFSCGQKRLYTAFAATVQFVLLCAIIVSMASHSITFLTCSAAPSGDDICQKCHFIRMLHGIFHLSPLLYGTN
jgi:hypothetical protein